MLLHSLTNLPPTCGEICLHVLDQMVAKMHFLFSTDSYHTQSIKPQERLRRESSEKIILAGPATRKPYDFKMFRANDDKKKQPCHPLMRVWIECSIINSAFKHQWHFVFQVEVCELPTIYSNQEETDTRMVLYLHRAVALAWIQERSSQNP